MLVIKPYLLFRQFKHDKLQKQRQGGDVELERVAGPYSVFVEDNRVSVMQFTYLLVELFRRRNQRSQIK
jgi:hypothetical protein